MTAPSVLGRLASPRARPPFTVVRREAEVSPCGRFRWTLRRTMHEAAPTSGIDVLPWILLNPSSADDTRDDPTLSRLMGFAWRWGFDGCLVVNLFPFRDADPSRMLGRLKAGPLAENVHRVAAALAPYDAAIAGWGAAGGRDEPTVRAAALGLLEAVDANIARERPLALYALGLTRHGHPTHPLARGRWRVPDDAVPRALSREVLAGRMAA